MSLNLDELLYWFPAGTAEGERTILERVFIYAAEFANVLAPPTGSPYLLVGNKGSGKSAVLDFAIRVLKQQNVPAVLLTPVDINTSGLDENASTGDMVRAFSDILLASIAAKLSEQSTGWFSGDYATLYSEAIGAKTRSPDFVSRFGRFFSEAAKPLLQADLNAAFPHLTSVTRSELEAAVARVVDDVRFYLYVDDTDQVANPERPNHLNRIWALMLAVRRLTSIVPELRAVITLRREVWERLQSDPAGQRDQTDHFKSLCIAMHGSNDHVGQILDRRVNLGAGKLGAANDPYSAFFEGISARAPFSQDWRSWKDLIVVRSRQRPRDAIQLVNHLAQAARAQRKSKIDETIFQTVMPTFSAELAAQFAQEVTKECPQALEVLRAFVGANFDAGSFTMTAEEAKAHFSSVLTRFGITLYGLPLNQSEGSTFELWKFLFRSGVMNARVSDKTKKDGFRHLDPTEDPGLVSKARWNDMQKTLWEINTAYRDYLISLEQEASKRSGLPLKRPKRRDD